MTDYVFRVIVDIPVEAGRETIDRITDAVFDAAHEAQPADRNWDVCMFGHECDADHPSAAIPRRTSAARSAR